MLLSTFLQLSHLWENARSSSTFYTFIPFSTGMYITTSRLLRLLGACLLSICIAAPLVFTHNQIRFQRFLSSHYITFDDFPSVYADTLRSKVFQSLERGTFDYASYFHSNTSTSESQTIPPNIHFIWFKDLYSSHLDVSKIPSDGSHAPHLCANHNPDYTVTVWNATAGRGLLEKHYEWFLPTYDGYKFPIQRIDALKYFILWHFGGIYMDMDISCRRPLDPLLGYPAWFPEASPLGTNNDLMASRPRHPVISLMLENLTKRNRNLIFPYLTIFWSTGPQFASDMLKKWFLETGSHTAADRKGTKTSSLGTDIR